MDTMTVYDAS